MQGHAAANVVPVIAANRIGEEKVEPVKDNNNQSSALVFYGSSFITDETGEVLEDAGRTEEKVILHTFDLDAILQVSAVCTFQAGPLLFHNVFIKTPYRTGELAAVQNFSVIQLLHSCDEPIEMKVVDSSVFFWLVIEHGMKKLTALRGKISIAYNSKTGVTDVANHCVMGSRVHSLHGTVDSHITSEVFPPVVSDTVRNGGKAVTKFSVALL